MTPEPGVLTGSSKKQRRKLRAWLGFVFGLSLLLAAGVVLFREPGAFDHLVEGFRGASVSAKMFVLLSPVLNWLLVGSCLWLLLRRHGEIRLLEMNALVGSAWLLNHLPMRPGLIGRVGYHKLVNGIRVRDSVEATVWSLVLAAASGALLMGLALLADPQAGLARTALWAIVPLGVVFGASAFIWTMGSANAGRLLAAFGFRYADMVLWAARYAVVFEMMDVQTTPVSIILVTGVSQVAQLIPIAGGGLGLREWAVGLTAGASGAAFEAAIGADLINRAAETAVVIPVGLLCAWAVARLVARHRSERNSESVVST